MPAASGTVHLPGTHQERELTPCAKDPRLLTIAPVHAQEGYTRPPPSRYLPLAVYLLITGPFGRRVLARPRRATRCSESVGTSCPKREPQQHELHHQTPCLAPPPTAHGPNRWSIIPAPAPQASSVDLDTVGRPTLPSAAIRRAERRAQDEHSYSRSGVHSVCARRHSGAAQC